MPQGETYDEAGSLDSRLRGVVSAASDDEHESMLSGTFSDAEDSLAGGIRGLSPGMNEGSKAPFSLPQRSVSRSLP